MIKIPNGWKELLGEEEEKKYFQELQEFLKTKVSTWPKEENIFKAYELCKPSEVKVVIIGQDPYPNAHAHGLSFSTTQKNRPVSLRYIFQEILDNYPEYKPEDFPTNNLTSWAEQGVFLLNAVLTVDEGVSNSHKGKGWEIFTRKTILKLMEDPTPKMFMLWGRFAQTLWKDACMSPSRGLLIPHQILTSGHPAAAAYGKNLFSGNRHFHIANEYLKLAGREPIVWTTKS